MGWEARWDASGCPVRALGKWTVPYDKCQVGLAQFAEILLKFPEVMERFVCTEGHTPENPTTADRYARYGGAFQGYLVDCKHPTQANILDELLRLKGKIE